MYNFSFCQWNASYSAVEHFKWTKVTLWATSLYYVTLSIGDKVRIEKHVQLYPLTIRYVLKNMCNFSFCYEKTYCTYTVLLILAHADHCCRSPLSTQQFQLSSSKSNSYLIYKLPHCVTLSIGDKVRFEKHVQLLFLSMKCFILSCRTLQVDKSNTLSYLTILRYFIHWR